MTAVVTNEVVVYRARNTLTGAQYIGVTRRGLGRREHEHRYEARRGGKGVLHKALRKYGDEAIVFEVIADFAGDYELAMAFEAELVDKEQPEYNLVPGGRNRVGAYSLETVERMRASHVGKPSPRKGVKASETAVAKLRGQKRTPEQRARMSAAHAGKLRPWRVGLKHTAEAKAKMSATRKGRVGYWRGKERPGLGAKLSAALKGRPGWAKGIAKSEEAKAKISAAKKGCAPPSETPLMRTVRVDNMRRAAAARRRPVVCVEDGREFGAITEAAAFYALDKGNVYRAVRRYPLATAGGKHFRYAEVAP